MPFISERMLDKSSGANLLTLKFPISEKILRRKYIEEHHFYNYISQKHYFVTVTFYFLTLHE